MTRVLISGDGVAARCCAHLLARSGVSVSFQPLDRPRLPAIMLSESAQALIREVFGRDALFRDLPRIQRRIVRWGPSASFVALDHSAVVVSEELLLESLLPALPIAAGATPDWAICASRGLPAPAEEHTFGSR